MLYVVFGYVLLKVEVQVAGDEYVKLLLSFNQKHAVFESCPAHPLCRNSVVARQRAGEPPVQALIDENAHPSDGFQHRELAGFDNGDGLLALYRRKTIKEIFDRRAPFEVVNKVLERNSRTNKDRCAAHDLLVGVNDAFEFFQLHASQYIRWPSFYEARKASVARRTLTSGLPPIVIEKRTQ
jgi:hypothetical protein